MSDVAKLERDLAAAQLELEQARAAALESPEGDVGRLARGIGALRLRIGALGAELEAARAAEEAEAAALAELKEERARRQAAGEAAKLEKRLARAWDEWQSAWLRLNAAAVELEGQLEQLKPDWLELKVLSARAGQKPEFQWTIRPDVQAKRGTGRIVWPDARWM